MKTATDNNLTFALTRHILEGYREQRLAKQAFSYTPHITIKYIQPDEPLPVQRVEPIPVTFKSITLYAGGIRKDFPLTGELMKSGNSGDHWVTSNGRHILIGADGKPKDPTAFKQNSAKVETARRSMVITDKAVQDIADKTEAKLSQAIGIPRTKNNSAFDLRNDDVGIEVKTMVTGKNDKITMSKHALGRKVAEAQAEGLKTFTVVADMRNRSSARYYVSEKLGSLRIGSMTPVSISQLKAMVKL